MSSRKQLNLVLFISDSDFKLGDTQAWIELFFFQKSLANASCSIVSNTVNDILHFCLLHLAHSAHLAKLLILYSILTCEKWIQDSTFFINALQTCGYVFIYKFNRLNLFEMSYLFAVLNYTIVNIGY